MTGNRSESPESAAAKKRTRFLLTKQSKFGCYTCKQRRIKCDEEKPSCQRCQRSGRVCGGYPPITAHAHGDRAASFSPPSTDSSNSNHGRSISPLHSAVNVVPWSSPQQQRFLCLGQAILGSDPFQMYSQSDFTVFNQLVPQLSVHYPSVNAAAAAFGAAYESSVLNHGDPLTTAQSDEQYGIALRMLSLELAKPDPQYAVLVVASTLLAAAETLHARQKGALAHILGALGIFASRQQRSLPSPDSSPSSAPGNGGLSDDIIDMLENLCLSVDVLVATFTWGQQPNLPPPKITTNTVNPQTMEELCSEQPKIVHACLHFIAEASQEMFKEYSDLPYTLIVKQATVISWLRTWLSCWTTLFETNTNVFSSPPRLRNLHLLKAQILALLIAVSNIRTSSQTSYDKYHVEFDEILRCADLVLSPPSPTPTTAQDPPPLLPFTPALGIIQPLFLTARKYRSSLPRRHAIRLLRRSGFEGPFGGDFEADLATRFVEIEEDRPFTMQLDEETILSAPQIPDWRRICSCWRLSEKHDLVERRIRFCRRRRYTSTDRDESGGWGLPVRRPGSPSNPVQDGEQWEVWEEVLQKPRREKAYPDSDPIPDNPFQWVVLSGELDVQSSRAHARAHLQTPTHPQINTHTLAPLHAGRLSRDPDWVKSAVGTGEYFNFMDPLKTQIGADWARHAVEEQEEEGEEEEEDGEEQGKGGRIEGTAVKLC